jgi:molybdate transport system substrate-binding protein
MLLCFLTIVMTIASTNAAPAEPVLLHAAGSLRGPLTEIAAAFETVTTLKVQAKFGASGLLKDEIAAGGKAEVFASANMEHPQALAKAGKSGPVVLFARNQLCALVRPGLAVTSDTLLERMLDPLIKLGSSTPRADPSGDHAFEAFRRADVIKSGASAALEKKALQLTGGANSRRRARISTASWSSSAPPISSSPIAPMRSQRRANIPISKSWRCRMLWPSAPTTVSP